MDTDYNDFRNRFLCKSCKKNLISKESLDNHIINCYETKIEKIKEKYISQIENLEKEYNENCDKMNDFFINHLNSIENKYINLINYLNNQIIKMYLLSEGK